MPINTALLISSTPEIQPVPSAVSQAAGHANASSPTAGVTVDISRPGQLLDALKELAESDPDKFKSVTAEIAKNLKDAAAASQSGSAAQILNKLADRFSSASQSGNASDLTPSPQQGQVHHHGHRGHHRAQEAGAVGAAGPTGAGSSDSVGSIVQGIVATALGSA